MPKSRAAAGWERVTLTPLEEADLEAVYVWHNTPMIRDLLTVYRYPVQREAVRDWFRNMREATPFFRIPYAIRLDGELVGVVELHSINNYQRRALMGIYIGNPRARQAGIGTMASALLLDFAFNGLDLRKVNLDVVASNAAAIKLYRKLGFVHEGTRRQDYFMGGKAMDMELFGILKEEFTLTLPDNANRLVFVAD